MVFIQELKRFASSTSVKGIGRIVKSDSIVLRICWILATTVFLGIALYQAIGQISSYYDYQTVIKVEEKRVWPNRFDIASCNCV